MKTENQKNNFNFGGKFFGPGHIARVTLMLFISVLLVSVPTEYITAPAKFTTHKMMT